MRKLGNGRFSCSDKAEVNYHCPIPIGIPNAKGYHHETIVSVQVEYYMLTVLSI